MAKKETITLYDVSEKLMAAISKAKRDVMEADPTKRNVTNTEAINFITFGSINPE